MSQSDERQGGYYTYRKDAEAAARAAGPGATVNFRAGYGYYVNYKNPTPTAQTPTQGIGTTPTTGVTTDIPVEPASDPYSGFDWNSYLGMFGLPSDVLAYINNMKKTGNLQTDLPNILAYIRGTPWYANTYPGIGEAMARGLVANEADYRSKQNQYQQLYKQYWGSDPDASGFSSFLGTGKSLDTLAKEFQGQKYIDANRGDIQYYSGAFGEGRLSEEQLTQLGQNQAGLGTVSGQSIQAAIDKATQRAQRIFQGSLASGGFQNVGGRLASNPQPTDVGR